MLKKEILDTDQIFPLLIKVSIPTMIGNFAFALYNIVDSIFVGRYVSSNALAALTITHVIQLVFIAFSAWLSVGTGTLISRSLGAKQYDRVNHIVLVGSFYILLISFLISMIFLLFLEPILLHIGATENILQDTILYTKWILLFGFLTPINGVFASILRARGLTKQTMVLSLVGAFLNIILDALFIIVFKWGVEGAAIATVLAQTIMMIGSIYYITKSYELFNLKYQFTFFDMTLLKQITMIGMPSGARLGVIALAGLMVNKSLESYGVSALAAYGIASRIISLAFMPIQGCNFGAQPIIAFNLGANRLDRLKKTIFISLKIMIFIGILGSLCFIFVPSPFFQLFTKDLEIIFLAENSLAYMGCLFFMFSVYMFLSAFVQSVGYIKQAMFLALSRPILIIFLSVILPPIFGLKGLWMIMPITDLINAILAIVVAKKVYFSIKHKMVLYQLKEVQEFPEEIL